MQSILVFVYASCVLAGCTLSAKSDDPSIENNDASMAVDATIAIADGSAPPPSPTPAEQVRVAFVGDLGVLSGSATTDLKAVLALANTDADLLVLSGDFIYNGSTPAQWHAAMADLTIPYIAAEGNHDEAAWASFKPLIDADLNAEKTKGVECTGDTGTKQTCTYKGVFFVVSAIGTSSSIPKDDAAHVSWISSALSGSTAQWKVCTWHKNQQQMQVGAKSDEVGWKAYQACQGGGAIVATAHEHSYGRTKTLTNIGAAADHGATGTGASVDIAKGKTLVFHSGMGGNDLRAFAGAGSWFASYYTNDKYMKNGVTTLTKPSGISGLTIITFNVGGDAKKAKGVFKLTSGAVIDEFDIVAQ